MDRRTFIATAAGTGAALQLPGLAAAQANPAGDWPREPVRIVIPYAAGGPTEVAPEAPAAPAAEPAKT